LNESCVGLALTQKSSTTGAFPCLILSLLASLNKSGFCFKFCNRIIYQHAFEQLKLRGMGTTTVLAWITEKQLQLYHVGDSRAYRLRDYRLTCLTQDHTSTSFCKTRFGINLNHARR